jgi:threonine/homoserine/homoserine lactone efflux protein
MNLYLFFISSFLLNITPGNDMMFVVSRALSQGRSAGIYATLGIFIGCFFHILLTVFGVALLLSRAPVVFTIIKTTGAAYLIYLGIMALLQKTNTEAKADRMVVNKLALVRQGIITNVLNPKVALFFLSFLPQFISAKATEAEAKGQLLFLGLWFDLQGALLLVIMCFMIGLSSNFFRRHPQFWNYVQKACGLVLVLLGIRILV